MNILFALLGASAAPPEAVSLHMRHQFRDATIGLEAWISGDRATAVRFLEQVGQHPIAPGLPKNTAATGVDAASVGQGALGELGLANTAAEVEVRPRKSVFERTWPAAFARAVLRCGHLARV